MWQARLAMLVMIGLGFGSYVRADSAPSVRFSTGRVVECRDVTPPEFAALYPDEKLIEAQFRVSVLLWQGSEQQIDELLVVFSSPERRMRVVDFWPKTESATDITGPIERSETNENSNTLQAGIKGALKGGQGGVTGEITPTLGAEAAKRSTIKEQYRKLPEKHLILASGPLDGDYSVYFKLKPSTQASLEGSRQFQCVFAVPADWRADWGKLTCIAKGRSTRQLVTRSEECGRSAFSIGFHMAGDAEAKLLAEQLDTALVKSQHSAAAAEITHANSRTLLTSRPNWSTALMRMIGLRANQKAPMPARHDTFKPAPTIEESLEALRNFSGDSSGQRPLP